MTNLNDENKLTNVVDTDKSTEITLVNSKSPPLVLSSEKSSSPSVFDFDQLENGESVADSFKNSNTEIDTNDLGTSLDKLIIQNQPCETTDEDVKKQNPPTAIIADLNASAETLASEVEEFIRNQLKENLRDRLFMLNIERSLIEFINDERLDLYKFMPMNRYYRMFVHRIAEYFGLGHNLDQTKQCIIVKKLKKPGVSAQKESFKSIIDKAEADKTSDSSSDSLTSADTTVATTNGDSQTPRTKHTILKREVGSYDSNLKNKARQTNESNRLKTYEEKSADYIRIKNRIFSNEAVSVTHPYTDPNGGMTASNTNNTANRHPKKLTILNRQNNDKTFNQKPAAKIVPSNQNQAISSEQDRNANFNNSNRHPNNRFKRLESDPANKPEPMHSSFSYHAQIPQYNNYQNNISKANQSSYQHFQSSTGGLPNFQQPFQVNPSQKSFTIANPTVQQRQQSFLVPNHHLTSNSMHEVSQHHKIHPNMLNNGPPLLQQAYPNNGVFFYMNNGTNQPFSQPSKQVFQQNQNMQVAHNQYMLPPPQAFQQQLPFNGPSSQSFNSIKFQQIGVAPPPFVNHPVNRF